MSNSDPIKEEAFNPHKFTEWPCDQQQCLTCGLCASACPVAGVDNFDPRKITRLINLGLVDILEAARWPWICTMCGKCEYLCPMGIDLTDLMRHVRSLRPKADIPGILQKGLEAALETGNNLRLPQDDYLFILEDVAEEIQEEPGFEDFQVPVDKENARLLTTIHNKLVNTHTEDLKHWWKIFHVAREDWTVCSANWEGTSWGFFTGNDNAVKTMAGRIADQMLDLKIDTLLWPE
jgi:heterodisulfide reductase subunit C